MANPYIDALAGTSWLSAGFDNHFTYTFDNTGSGGGWSAAYKAGYTAALQSWANVANLSIEETIFSPKLVETLWTASSFPLDSRGDLGLNGTVNWRHKGGTPYVPSPLLYEGKLYLKLTKS